eukprot:gb/GECG01016555.1/.p1 GENE.gb/GECG01016555.1/~~gb/GECG01016555.1/.p1  ORF type:complete len:136 (+),score=17.22 gb/GECG01016555.1/:1-408(+)
MGGKARKTKKFAAVKRMLSPKDTRLQSNKEKQKEENKPEEPRHVQQAPTALYFKYNTQLGPPYFVLVDTNFINFSIKNKLDIVRSMMDCLLAKCKWIVDVVTLSFSGSSPRSPVQPERSISENTCILLLCNWMPP